MSVGLAMIVKDATATLPRAIESIRRHINHWTILDTGSTDGTPELAERLLAGIPGRLYRDEFVDFATTRTLLLALARGTADYLLLLDADLEINYPGDLGAAGLSADVVEGRILDGPITYDLPILIRDRVPWCYQGVAHAYLDRRDGAPFTTSLLDGLTVTDHGHPTEAKIRRDLGLLTAEHARNPLDPRTTFYLAQTYMDLGMIREAIQFYRARAHMTGFDEETFIARFHLGVLLCEHVSFDQGAAELLAAWRLRPSRIEPLRALASAAANVADKTAYPVGDRLFVRPSAYTTREGES